MAGKSKIRWNHCKPERLVLEQLGFSHAPVGRWFDRWTKCDHCRGLMAKGLRGWSDGNWLFHRECAIRWVRGKYPRYLTRLKREQENGETRGAVRPGDQEVHCER